MASGRSCWREAFPMTSRPTTCPHGGVDTRRTVVEKRAERARNLVHLGELSAARIALEGAQVAPGTLATLRELTNLERRPPRPRQRQQMSEEVIQWTPSVGFELDESQFLICLRTARRGAAGGPSGMTADHLQPMLDNEHDSELLSQAASILAQGTIPR